MVDLLRCGPRRQGPPNVTVDGALGMNCDRGRQLDEMRRLVVYGTLLPDDLAEGFDRLDERLVLRSQEEIVFWKRVVCHVNPPIDLAPAFVASPAGARV
ncbi:MAG: hypothetical protein H6R26_3225 [Proteobacteria bacterium]|nr:hypothetical protein [Pseudomonadota bacterium]